MNLSFNNSIDSHIPVLIGLSKLLGSSCRRILEFGSGFNSTLLFCDKAVFPHAESIISCENNAEWHATISKCIQFKSNMDYRFVEGRMFRAVNPSEVSSSDLVFIDDSHKAYLRLLTIFNVLRCSPSLCVVHDTNRPLNSFLMSAYGAIKFNALHPCTSVLSSTVSSEDLIMLNNRISLHSQEKNPSDLRHWLDTL